MAATVLTLVACDKAGLYPDDGLQTSTVECLVLNEGLMNTNTGCLSVIYRDGGVAVDAFQDVNSRPMGDVAQSITLINGKYFVALNNSKKIEVIDPETFRSEGTILYTRAGNPRQIVAVSATEAVVSDQRNQLTRISTVPPYGEPLEHISVPAWIEYMAVSGEKLFGITSRGIVVFDLNDISADNARLIPDARNEEGTKTCRLLVDKEGTVWALMHQKEGGQVTGITLVGVDPTQEKVTKTYTLPFANEETATAGNPVGAINYTRTDIDPTGTYIYFNVKTRTDTADEEGKREQQSVWQLNVETGKFERYLDLPGVEKMYGFAVGPTGEVYLCDCLDYTAQRGYVRRYRKDGTVDSFRVGVYPSQVYFPGFEH